MLLLNKGSARRGATTMRKLLAPIVVGAMLGVAQVAAAGPLDDGQAAYDRGDYAAALKLLRPLADGGNATAQYDLATMYDGGQGVAQNYTEAMKWYRLAANQGMALAQFNLGVMYEAGKGVKRDYVRAHLWYNLAAASFNGEEGKKAMDIGKIVAAKMTPVQIKHAQDMSKWCLLSNYRDCD